MSPRERVAKIERVHRLRGRERLDAVAAFTGRRVRIVRGRTPEERERDYNGPIEGELVVVAFGGSSGVVVLKRPGYVAEAHGLATIYSVEELAQD